VSSRVERAASSLLVLAACAVAVSLIHREFFVRSASGPLTTASKAPEFMEDWRQIVRTGIVLGNPQARVHLVEFADLECPACRSLQVGVRAARAEYGDDLAVVFVHFPLPQHRFARPAARAAECAYAQGLFDKFQDLVYSKQDSLGLKSWISYAEEARVPELRRFERCVADTAPVARIEAGILLGKQLALRGTPTVILNGWRFWNPPSQTELVQAIAVLKDGKQLSSSKQ